MRFEERTLKMEADDISDPLVTTRVHDFAFQKMLQVFVGLNVKV
jgi:hypothetical protein